jgi:hypothetical protein
LHDDRAEDVEQKILAYEPAPMRRAGAGKRQKRQPEGYSRCVQPVARRCGLKSALPVPGTMLLPNDQGAGV